MSDKASFSSDQTKPQKSAGEMLTSDIPTLSNNTNNNTTDESAVHNTDTDTLPEYNDRVIYELKPTGRKHTPLLDNYNMNGPKRGHAVIINNESFHWTTGMNKRVGTDVDAQNLKRTFTKLGFKVHKHKDTSCIDLLEILQDMAAKDHTGSDCFVCAILSHGDDGCVYGTDGIIKIRKLVDMFRGDICPSLAGKPKIFIFQACRGTKHEIPVPPAQDVVDGPMADEDDEFHTVVVDSGPTPTLPSASDFLFCYSVAEGYYSHRDTLYGSWYVQDFTSVMNSLVFKEGSESVDFLDVLTAVHRRVSERRVERTMSQSALGKKQMPCFLSMLTKKLYFSKKAK
ncbi:unnamed protein product [Clavelina lepadiformis]|uniref:Caspase-6 n=1 Tax=Clavelina lepadiformis TaxID=159417 RepID=A0ABP0EW13_CLALP